MCFACRVGRRHISQLPRRKKEDKRNNHGWNNNYYEQPVVREAARSCFLSVRPHAPQSTGETHSHCAGRRFAPRLWRRRRLTSGSVRWPPHEPIDASAVLIWNMSDCPHAFRCTAIKSDCSLRRLIANSLLRSTVCFSARFRSDHIEDAKRVFDAKKSVHINIEWIVLMFSFTIDD